jgi:ethanolamine utilization protein EutN
MYLARIDGTLTSTARHAALENCQLLIGRRLDATGRAADEPIVLLDRIGARRGSTVMVSTDGAAVRRRLGNTVPARLQVVGIVDGVTLGPGDGER